jgi:hypothetical protein
MPDGQVNTGLFVKQVYTVATLPAASAQQGRVQWISDATKNPSYASGEIVAGGGTTATRVRSDGTTWRLYGWA